MAIMPLPMFVILIAVLMPVALLLAYYASGSKK